MAASRLILGRRPSCSICDSEIEPGEPTAFVKTLGIAHRDCAEVTRSEVEPEPEAPSQPLIEIEPPLERCPPEREPEPILPVDLQRPAPTRPPRPPVKRPVASPSFREDDRGLDRWAENMREFVEEMRRRGVILS